MVVFTEKQKEFIRMFAHDKLRRINILEGSVRSGKTWISVLVWALWVALSPADGNYLMTAKTLVSLKRNCLDLMMEMIGGAYFEFNVVKKEARLFGRRIYLEGANDSRSESKIRGMTLTGAYCDEITLLPEEFFSMLLSRLSKPGAMLLGTTNPDNPSHWLKTRFLDRADKLDLLRFSFTIDDNTLLDEDYVRRLKQEYTGVYYSRYILGQWVHCDGVIFTQFADDTERYLCDDVPVDLQFINVGVDFGGNNSKTVFVATGVRRSLAGFVVIDEEQLRDNGTIDGERLGKDFVRFIMRLRERFPAVPILRVRCDSAEQYLINGLRKAALAAGLSVAVVNALKRLITARIHFVNTLLNAGRLHVMRQCSIVAGSLRGQVWDTKALDEKRLDDGTCDIDTADAFEYSIEEFIR